MSSTKTKSSSIPPQPSTRTESRTGRPVDAEADPVAADAVGWNRRVSQLREVEQARGDDAALSVAFGEAVVTFDPNQDADDPAVA